MSSEIAAVVVGLGHHGQAFATQCGAAGIAVVAAADPAHSGRRLSELTGRPEHSGIRIVARLEDLGEPPADVLVLTAKLEPAAVVDAAVAGFARGWDCVTIVETVFEPDALSPVLRSRLDDEARQARRTFYATGVQDVAWSGLVLHATAMTRDLTHIRVTQHLGVDGYPELFLREIGAACRPEDLPRVVSDLAAGPPVLGAAVGPLLRGLGLTRKSEERRIEPVLAEVVLDSVTFGRQLQIGEIIGTSDTVAVETEEGVTIETTLTTTARPPGEEDVFSMALDGTPRVQLEHRLWPGPDVVDATLVNRLRDVIDAPPGVVLPEQLPMPRFQTAWTRRHGTSASTESKGPHPHPTTEPRREVS